jgi:hypothetical protein
MISVLILMSMTLTCLRLVLKTVREAWDLWDRYVARKGGPSEEALSGTGRDGRAEMVGSRDDGFQQLGLWP